VPSGGDGYYGGTRYFAVRSSGSYYPMSRTRYIAVRNVDLDDTPRYVAVRRSPASYEMGTRYVAVRNYAPSVRYVAVRQYEPRTRYIAVRNIDRYVDRNVDYDDDDAPQYVAVRRRPVYDSGTRYVAVRNTNRYYDDDDSRYVAVRSSLDEIEATQPRHVVVKSDYLAGTEEVIVPNSSYDDTAYAAPAIEDDNSEDVAYTPAAYAGGTSKTYLTTSEAESPCMHNVAVRTCDGTINTRTVGYIPAADDIDDDDQAILDGDGTTYVAAGDVDDACLSPVAYRASPRTITTRSVNYIPVEDVDDVAFQGGSEPTILNENISASTISYAPVIDDDDVDLKANTTYVAADNADDNCAQTVAHRSCGDEIGASNVSYVPVDDVEDVDTDNVSVVPVKDVEGVSDEPVSYIPADSMNSGAVSYVPIQSVDYVDTSDTAADCPISSSDDEG